MRLIDADQFGVIPLQGKSEDFIDGVKFMLEKIDEAPTVEAYIFEQVQDLVALNKKLSEERPHGECRTCKHFVKGGLDGKTYVCEHPNIEREDYYDYACLMVEENDFCSSYEARKKEGE